MGYETNFELSIKSTNVDISDVLEVEIDNNEDMSWAIEVTGETANSCTWYNHEADLRNLSLKYPELVFDLYGEGEENGDRWHKYFQNGKMQVCKVIMTFPEFCKNKLQ
jgi:hypothetical protein